MPPRSHLTAQERSFFQLVSRAAFSNPFSVERDELDRRIADSPRDDPHVLERLRERLGHRLEELEGRERLHIGRFSTEDAVLVEHAILFDAFHRYITPIDRLVEKQLDAGASPCDVPFARDVLELLTTRGFESHRAVRMLELFWQMRRAFFFIARGLVGRSASMRRLRESLWNAVFTQDIRRYERFLWNRMEDFSTILTGPTGTGKGAAAAAIGRSGLIPFDERKNSFRTSFTETFVPLNLGEFPESLIESELFGHRKGAFTGAIDAHEGVFARCSPYGAIFLDEIGEVTEPVQIKLLRVLQERAFSPVGSHARRRFDGRVIAATHRSLEELRKRGHFRDDFYYRLCSHLIEVPSLARRLAEDPRELDDLLEPLVARLVGDSSRALVDQVREAIARDLGPSYEWPGNVRELEQCIRRVLLTGRCAPDKTAPGPGDGVERLQQHVRDGTVDARGLVAQYCAVLYARYGTYEHVARVTGLDRRTVRKHVQQEAPETG